MARNGGEIMTKEAEAFFYDRGEDEFSFSYVARIPRAVLERKARELGRPLGIEDLPCKFDDSVPEELATSGRVECFSCGRTFQPRTVEWTDGAGRERTKGNFVVLMNHKERTYCVFSTCPSCLEEVTNEEIDPASGRASKRDRPIPAMPYEGATAFCERRNSEDPRTAPFQQRCRERRLRAVGLERFIQNARPAYSSRAARAPEAPRISPATATPPEKPEGSVEEPPASAVPPAEEIAVVAAPEDADGRAS